MTQETGDRVLGREGEPEAIVIEQAPPEFLATVDDADELAAALGLERADLAGDAQVVSTGVAHLMVPVRDRAVVERVAADAPRLRAARAACGSQSTATGSASAARES